MVDRVLDVTTLGATPALPGVVRVAWERRVGDGYRCDPGRWSFNQTTVQITLAGCGACWPDGGGAGRPVPPGRALVYVGHVHRDLAYGLGDGVTPWEFLYVNLHGTVAQAVITDLAALHGSVVPIATDHPVVAECLALLPRGGHAHRAWPLSDSTGLAQRLLLALSTAPAAGGDSAPDADDQLVARAMRLLAPRLGERWSVARLAGELRISREHLSRVFTARTGHAPATWLRRQRVAAAARRLRGGAAVADLAHACGFVHAAHFARIFRQHTGLTPMAFRRRGGLPGW